MEGIVEERQEEGRGAAEFAHEVEVLTGELIACPRCRSVNIEPVDIYESITSRNVNHVCNRCGKRLLVRQMFFIAAILPQHVYPLEVGLAFQECIFRPVHVSLPLSSRRRYRVINRPPLEQRLDQLRSQACTSDSFRT